MRYSWIAVMVCACAPGAGSARGQGPAQAQGPSTQPGLDALVAQLGDQRFAVRDRATEALSALDPRALDELVRRYRDEPRCEQRLRLRAAIENVYYRKLMAGQVGFLGVTPGVLPAVYDPRTGQTVECIVAERLIENAAAMQGGMRPKDILLDFDRQPIAKYMQPQNARAAIQRNPGLGPDMSLRVAAIEAFTSHVKMREPGTRVPIRVLRLGEPRKVRVAAGAHFDSVAPSHALAPTLLSSEQNQGLIAGLTAGGLVVTRVPERSWISDAHLQVNDLIVGMDQPLPANVTAESLEALLQAAGSNGGVVLEVRPLEQVELTITLGARPPEMMNMPDWEEAQKRFATWWRDTLGEPSLRIRKPRVVYFASITPTAPPTPEPEVLP